MMDDSVLLRRWEVRLPLMLLSKASILGKNIDLARECLLVLGLTSGDALNSGSIGSFSVIVAS